jgi:hypothetical protein
VGKFRNAENNYAKQITPGSILAFQPHLSNKEIYINGVFNNYSLAAEFKMFTILKSDLAL